MSSQVTARGGYGRLSRPGWGAAGGCGAAALFPALAAGGAGSPPLPLPLRARILRLK